MRNTIELPLEHIDLLMDIYSRIGGIKENIYRKCIKPSLMLRVDESL